MIANPRFCIWLLIMSLAATACPLHADQQSAPTVRHHKVAEETTDPVLPEIIQAEAAMAKQDFSAAETLLKKAVEASPESDRGWFDLGYVYSSTKRIPESVDAYRKSVEANAEVFESNLNLGILLARQGNSTEAAKYLKRATQLQPTANADQGLARAWLSLGLVEEERDPDLALDAFNTAAKLTPSDPVPHLSAALLLEKQGQWDAAAHEYQAASALDPKSTEAIRGLANLYSRQKKYSEAELQLRKLLAADPSDNNARIELGRTLALEGKNDEAASFLAADKSGSSDPRAALELGTVFVNAGNYPQAEQEFRLALQGMPSDGEAHFALGSVLMQEKKYPEAQHELLLAAKFKPGIGEIYGNLAVVAAENKNYDLAIKALDERTKYLPEIPATYFLRATSYDNLKANVKAVENYQKFLATDGGKAPDQEWQARHRLMALDPDHAVKYAEKK
jgi:Flp pilus assembly protein TadD